MAAALLSIVAAPAGATQTTAPFIVNTYQPGAQYLESTATGYNGDTAMMWLDAARSGYHYLRRFDGTGAAIDSGDWYAGPGGSAQVAIDGWGDFAVVRSTDGGPGHGENLVLTVYDRSGVALTSAIRVNLTDYALLYQFNVAMNRWGQIVVGWQESSPSPPSGYTIIKARAFTPDGVALTSSEMIVCPSAYQALISDLAVADDGDFAVVYTRIMAQGSLSYFQKFRANGSPYGSAQRAGSSTTAYESVPTLAMNGQGSAVVAWRFTEPKDTYWIGVHAQRFGPSGSKSGAELAVVNETSVGPDASVSGVEAGMNESGAFSLAFSTTDGGQGPTRLQMREYDNVGNAVGSPFGFPAPAGDSWYLPYNRPRMASSPAGVLTLGQAVVSQTDAANIDVGALRYTMDQQATFATLTSGVPVANQSTSTGKWIYYRILVPNATSTLTLSTAGANGNADLYGRAGALPTMNNAEVVNTAPGSSQAIVIHTPPPGLFYIGVYAQQGFTGLTVTATATH